MAEGSELSSRFPAELHGCWNEQIKRRHISSSFLGGHALSSPFSQPFSSEPLAAPSSIFQPLSIRLATVPFPVLPLVPRRAAHPLPSLLFRGSRIECRSNWLSHENARFIREVAAISGPRSPAVSQNVDDPCLFPPPPPPPPPLSGFLFSPRSFLSRGEKESSRLRVPAFRGTVLSLLRPRAGFIGVKKEGKGGRKKSRRPRLESLTVHLSVEADGHEQGRLRSGQFFSDFRGAK